MPSRGPIIMASQQTYPRSLLLFTGTCGCAKCTGLNVETSVVRVNGLGLTLRVSVNVKVNIFI
jgi:hypothetical protein